MSKHLIIVAGEASGDMHAAHLVEALKRLRPSITFSGLGGPKMRAAGVELYKDLTEIAVVGFIEVLRHYSEFKKAFNLVLKKVNEIKPRAVILVDYPGFNLRLAAALKKNGIRVIYYISPQVWAWKKNRVFAVKRWVDLLLVLFKFERDFYAPFGVAAVWVGHPLIDQVKVKTTREEFLRSHGLSSDKITVGILPGSRQKEIDALLPPMIEAAAILTKRFPGIQFLILKAPTVSLKNFDQKRALPSNVKIIENQTYDGIHASDACLTASGTATLETALLQRPMVVVYKTSFLTWLLAKFLVKISNIGLVNVVAGKRIVPECIQFQATGHCLAQTLGSILSDPQRMTEIKSQLRTAVESLGSEGASRRAAEEIVKRIG